jgi:hypothetical protein
MLQELLGAMLAVSMITMAAALAADVARSASTIGRRRPRPARRRVVVELRPPLAPPGLPSGVSHP